MILNGSVLYTRESFITSLNINTKAYIRLVTPSFIFKYSGSDSLKVCVFIRIKDKDDTNAIG